MNHLTKNYDPNLINNLNKNIRVANLWQDLILKLINFKNELNNYPDQLKLADDAFYIYLNMFKDPVNYDKCKNDANSAYQKIILIKKIINLDSYLTKLYIKLGLYKYISNLHKSYIEYQNSAKIFDLELNIIGF